MRGVSLLTFVSIVALAAATTGCARPKSDNITAFANATSALSGFAKNVAELDTEIDGKQRLIDAANKYSFATNTNDITFQPKGGVLLRGKSDDDWKAVTGFLDGVSAYADALAKANDPSLVSGLTDKVSSAGTALSNVAAARNPNNTRNSKHIAAIGDLVAELVGVAANMYATVEIHTAMEKAQSVLDRAQPHLRAAIDVIHKDAKSKLGLYQQTLWCNLVYAKGLSHSECPLKGSSQTPTRLAQADIYVAVYQEYLALETRMDAFGSVSGAIDKMVRAHAKLKDNLDDIGALNNFLESVGAIAEKLEKVKSLRSGAGS